MQSRWDEAALAAVVDEYSAAGINRDLAVRVYTTRLLGLDPALVLHGGGNTSVKTEMTDDTGATVPVLCVKGSGWDMAVIEPAGLPAVRLQPLQAMGNLDALSDDEMVARQRALLLDPKAPTPSVEAILHALLPFRHVDHTHANAIVSLTNQPTGEATVRDLFPDSIVVPYVMPGFELAKACKAAFEARPDADGMILLKHGIFTWSDDPREAYEKMIAAIDKAERAIASRRSARKPAAVPAKPGELLPLDEIGPILRGALMAPDKDGVGRRFVLQHRAGPATLEFCDRPDLPDLVRRGNATPEHVLHIKRFGVALPVPRAEAREEWARAANAAVAAYEAEYRDYFERNNARAGGGKRMVDPLPRVFYIPQIGIFAAGATLKAARIGADVAEATMEVIVNAEAGDGFEALSEADLFDIEYWSLEQAKLARAVEKPLTRCIALIAGKKPIRGEQVAAALREAGAEVVSLSTDDPSGQIRATAAGLGGVDIIVDLDGALEDTEAAAIRNVVTLQNSAGVYLHPDGARLPSLGVLASIVLPEDDQIVRTVSQALGR